MARTFEQLRLGGFRYSSLTEEQASDIINDIYSNYLHHIGEPRLERAIDCLEVVQGIRPKEILFNYDVVIQGRVKLR